jgi:hypothetical protein
VLTGEQKFLVLFQSCVSNVFFLTDGKSVFHFFQAREIIFNESFKSDSVSDSYYKRLFKNSFFPIAWKQANVFPILKPGKDPYNPKSYRPISLLNALRKILERLLLHRLKSCVAEHRICIS